MALTNENGGMYMPVAPAYAGGNGFGNSFGGDWGWIILLILLAGGNGWGGGFGGYGGADIYPWMNQANITSNGFQNQMLNENITSIRDGITGISTQLCNGFGDVQILRTHRLFLTLLILAYSLLKTRCAQIRLTLRMRRLQILRDSSQWLISLLRRLHRQVESLLTMPLRQ